MGVPSRRGTITGILAIILCALAILIVWERVGTTAQARRAGSPLSFPGSPTQGPVTATPTPLGFQTDTQTATATATATDTPTISANATSTATTNLSPVTVTFTPSDTSTPSSTETLTSIPTGTGTATGTATVTGTPTTTGTPTLTGTVSPTESPTATSTGSPGAGSPITATESPTGTAGAPVFQAGAVPAAAANPSGGFISYFAEGYTGQIRTNGKVSSTEVLNLLNLGSQAAPITITYYFPGGGTPLTVSRMIASQGAARESVNADVGPDRVVSVSIRSTEKIFASRTITRVGTGGRHLDGSTSLPAGATSSRWDFAEGFTGASFQEYLALFNPGSLSATVTLKAAPQAASAKDARAATVSVPALGRITVNMHALNLGAHVTTSGVLVSADQPIIAERVEYFGSGAGSAKAGSTVVLGLIPGAGQRSLRIPFADSGGMSAATVHQPSRAVGDQAYLALLNPSARSVTVTADFADGSGKGRGAPVTIKLAAGTRGTIGANAVIGSRLTGPFSVALGATGPIEAESAQYFGGSPNQGSAPGIIVPAASVPLTDAAFTDLGQTLADGTPVARRLYIYNPGAVPAQVTVTYHGSADILSGSPTYMVPPDGITTVDVGQDETERGPMGAELRSSEAFVALAVGMTSDGKCAIEEPASAVF